MNGLFMHFDGFKTGVLFSVRKILTEYLDKSLVYISKVVQVYFNNRFLLGIRTTPFLRYGVERLLL